MVRQPIYVLSTDIYHRLADDVGEPGTVKLMYTCDEKKLITEFGNVSAPCYLLKANTDVDVTIEVQENERLLRDSVCPALTLFDSRANLVAATSSSMSVPTTRRKRTSVQRSVIKAIRSHRAQQHE